MALATSIAACAAAEASTEPSMATRLFPEGSLSSLLLCCTIVEAAHDQDVAVGVPEYARGDAAHEDSPYSPVAAAPEKH